MERQPGLAPLVYRNRRPLIPFWADPYPVIGWCVQDPDTPLGLKTRSDVNESVTPAVPGLSTRAVLFLLLLSLQAEDSIRIMGERSSAPPFLLLKHTHIWYTFGMNRTVRIQLKPPPEQHAVLLDTLRQFTTAFNLVCATGWQQEEKNGVRLHHLTYYRKDHKFAPNDV